ncbi:MAG: Lrp/AsnC family transcriptional regulator [SAR202 cluster bacterium]|nr:Lrp/AsnC family transcriptional regulator [SAR202 cluster bacterium]
MIRAYVLIEVSPGHSRAIVAALKGRQGVPEVSRVTGQFDIIAVLEADSVDGVSNIVNDVVHTMEGVVRTTTCIALG